MIRTMASVTEAASVDAYEPFLLQDKFPKASRESLLSPLVPRRRHQSASQSLANDLINGPLESAVSLIARAERDGTLIEPTTLLRIARRASEHRAETVFQLVVRYALENKDSLATREEFGRAAGSSTAAVKTGTLIRELLNLSASSTHDRNVLELLEALLPLPDWKGAVLSEREILSRLPPLVAATVANRMLNSNEVTSYLPNIDVLVPAILELGVPPKKDRGTWTMYRIVLALLAENEQQRAVDIVEVLVQNDRIPNAAYDPVTLDRFRQSVDVPDGTAASMIDATITVTLVEACSLYGWFDRSVLVLREFVSRYKSISNDIARANQKSGVEYVMSKMIATGRVEAVKASVSLLQFLLLNDPHDIPTINPDIVAELYIALGRANYMEGLARLFRLMHEVNYRLAVADRSHEVDLPSSLSPRSTVSPSSPNPNLQPDPSTTPSSSLPQFDAGLNVNDLPRFQNSPYPRMYHPPDGASRLKLLQYFLRTRGNFPAARMLVEDIIACDGLVPSGRNASYAARFFIEVIQLGDIDLARSMWEALRAAPGSEMVVGNAAAVVALVKMFMTRSAAHERQKQKEKRVEEEKERLLQLMAAPVVRSRSPVIESTANSNGEQSGYISPLRSGGVASTSTSKGVIIDHESTSSGLALSIGDDPHTLGRLPLPMLDGTEHLDPPNLSNSSQQPTKVVQLSTLTKLLPSTEESRTKSEPPESTLLDQDSPAPSNTPPHFDIETYLPPPNVFAKFAHQVMFEFKDTKRPLSFASHHDLTSLARLGALIGYTKQVFRVFDILLRRKEVPDMHDTNVIVGAMPPRKGYRLVKDGLAFGLEPDHVTWGTLLHNAIGRGDTELVSEILQSAEDTKVVLDEKALDTLVRRSWGMKRTEKAVREFAVRVYEVLKAEPREVIRPSLLTLCTWKTLTVGRWPKMAYRFWELRRKSGGEGGDEGIGSSSTSLLSMDPVPQMHQREIAEALLRQWITKAPGLDFSWHEGKRMCEAMGVEELWTAPAP